MSDPTIPPDIRALAREVGPDDHERIQPPDDVWDAIQATIASDPVSLSDRRRSAGPPGRLLLAAAAVAVVLGAVGVLVSQSGDDSTTLATAVITNEGLPVANSESGEARLVEVDGRLELRLDVPDLPAADGFYEVWIIDTEVQGMFSLGVVDGDGTYALPAGVDPADFPVVDVSIEPPDGDPTHSGQSIWRGQLDI